MLSKSNVSILIAAMLILVVMVSGAAAVEKAEPPQGEDQQAAKAGAPIPTLSEWGMIIFSVLLIGWMAYTVVQRRRRATSDL